MSAALDPYALDEDLMQIITRGDFRHAGAAGPPARRTAAIPGPYVVSENSDHELLIAAPWSPIVRPGSAQAFGDNRGAWIATITHQGRGDVVATYRQAAAHAALLAASPRLLASLEAIVGILIGPVDDDLDELADQILEAQAAIADATRTIL